MYVQAGKTENGFAPNTAAASLSVLACSVTFNFDLITKLSSTIKQIVGSGHKGEKR